MSERNAREELEGVLSKIGLSMVACRLFRDHYRDPEPGIRALPVGHLAAEREAVMRWIDFSYGSGFGCEWLLGTVWLSDGSWLERASYDGSEWWRHHRCPEPPTRKEVDDGP